MGAEEVPYPALDRLTGVERALWTRVLDRQFRAEGSRYRRNLRWYGGVSSTYLSVANLWLVLSLPLYVVVVVSGFAGNNAVLVAAVICALAVCGLSLIRLLMAVRSGREWRVLNSVGQPPRWKSRN